MSLFFLIGLLGVSAQGLNLPPPPMSEREKQDLEQTMNSEIYKKFSSYFEALLQVPPYKKNRYKESELAFAWNERVFHYDHCHNMNIFLGPGHIKPCLEEYSNKLTNENLEGLIVLDPEKLKESVLLHFGARLKVIENELPGFSAWLMSGFAKKWGLQKQQITESFCKNETLYKIKTENVACFANDLVRISESWFLGRGAESKEVAEIIVHELLRIKVSAVSHTSDLSRQQQDATVASLTVSVLNPQVNAQKIYKDLKDGLIIMNRVTAEELRLLHLAFLSDERLFHIKNAAVIAQGECLFPGFKPETFKDLITKSLKLVGECKRFLEPTDMPILCETDTIVLRMHSYMKNCPLRHQILPDVPKD